MHFKTDCKNNVNETKLSENCAVCNILVAVILHTTCFTYIPTVTHDRRENIDNILQSGV